MNKRILNIAIMSTIILLMATYVPGPLYQNEVFANSEAYGVYVGASKSLIKIAPDGTELLRLSRENIGLPESVDFVNVRVNPGDGTIWVWSPGLPTYIAHLSPNGEVLASWSIPNAWIKRLAVDPTDGSVWLSGGYDRYTYKYSIDGILLCRITSPVSPHWCAGVSVNSVEDTVWLTSSFTTVSKLNSDGSEILCISGFNNKGSILSVDETDGSVWIADTDNNEVVKLDTNGNELVRVNVGNEPYNVVANPSDGGVWVADEFTAGGPLKRLDANGNIIATSDINLPGGWVIGLDISYDGKVWLAETYAHKLHKLSPNGELLLTVGGDSATFYRPSFVSVFPKTYVNEPPVANAGGPYQTDEGTELLLDASGSFDPDGNIVLYEWDLDNDGEYDDDTGVTTSKAWMDNGQYTVGVKVFDEYAEANTDTASVTVNNVAPTVNPITIITVQDSSPIIGPITINSQIEASATFSDPGTLDTHTAEWDWGDGTSSGTVTENEGSGSVTDFHTFTTPGVYMIELAVTDDDGGSDYEVFEYVVVYDPDGGFVTGGGWIDSPEGAYQPDPSLTGKATFGFVSKYKRGTTTPTGETEFRFKAGDLNFHSSDYDWLVIAGSNAKIKGTGTVNGEGNFGFMLTSNDGGKGGIDTFRMKIVDKDTDTVVYDNGVDSELQGGCIVIHKG
jgi:streptogramin lyase